MGQLDDGALARRVHAAQAEARAIREAGKSLDYEAKAIESLARSWDLEGEPECQNMALVDALVWATLAQARATAALKPFYGGGPR